MKSTTPIIAFVLLYSFQDVLTASNLGIYFYREIGCFKKNGTLPQYQCPNFAENGTCRFKNSVLRIGDAVDKELLKGSCQVDCHCSTEGRITCGFDDCFERLKSGCSHFKYSLDSCCAIDSVCGPIAECTVDGETYQEGYHIYPKKTCEVCICDLGFKKEAPFCRPRKCFDQATHHLELSRFGAPVFFRNERCCPSTWIVDDGVKIIQINPKVESNSGLFCKYGDKVVKLGYGFEKTVESYGRTVLLKCECSIPPFIFCIEK